MLFVCFGLTACNHSLDFEMYRNAENPIILGKGTLSTDSVQWNNMFVSSTKELYFTKMGKSASIIHKLELEDGEFKNFQKLDFPVGEPHSDVFVNKEGDLMLFSSLMLENEKDTISDWNIWKSIRLNGKWQTPTPFFDKNIEGNQFYPWLTASGNLYFAFTPHGSQNSDLYISEFIDGKYQLPKALSSVINSPKLEGDPYVAPDESFLIFAGFERKQSLGKSDLYISLNSNGNWSVPIWMGKQVNSDGYDGSPFVTEDGKYLIFTSSRGSSDENTFFNHYIMKFSKENYKLID